MTGNLFEQPEPTPTEAIAHSAVFRDRARQLQRRRKRLSPPCGEGQTIKERFQQFHAENPHVYKVLVEIVREAKRRGIDKWSIKGAFEVARYERKFSTTDDQFKLRNDFTPHYARLIMEQEPDLDSIFATKELTAL
jgi:hypothetical protein